MGQPLTRLLLGRAGIRAREKTCEALAEVVPKWYISIGGLASNWYYLERPNMTQLAESISRKIHDEIAAGAYAPGAKLPSERELEQKYRVSRVTVNRALTRLHAHGLVERRRGSGTFVVEPRRNPSGVASSRKLVKYLASGARVRGDVYVSSGYEGMCNELNKHGKDVATRFYYSEADYIAEIASLADASVDAAIIWYCRSDEGDRRLQRLMRDGVRFVLLDNHSKDFECDYVGTDNAFGAQQMVRHLVDRGHRDIAYLTRQTSGLPSLENRQVGFVQEMLASGLPLTQESLWSFDPAVPGDLGRVVDAILDCRRRPTALFVANDLYAFDVYEQLKQRGVRVPDDISLVGFDNIDRSQYFEVPLTTVAQDFREMGRLAASIVQQPPREAPRELYYQISVKPSLVVRDSVAEPQQGVV